jgi:hypothetical protein
MWQLVRSLFINTDLNSATKICSVLTMTMVLVFEVRPIYTKLNMLGICITGTYTYKWTYYCLIIHLYLLQVFPF